MTARAARCGNDPRAQLTGSVGIVERLVHTVCFCNPDRALCGEDMTGHEWLPLAAYPDDCVVCDDLSDQPCEGCGRGHEEASR